MHLVYVDESGNVGSIESGGTQSFTLGCVIVSDHVWPAVFDQLLDYRRFLRDVFQLPIRAEVKANYLLRNGGAFATLQLSERKRFKIYRGFLRLQPKLGVSAFAVVILKRKMPSGTDPRQKAWEFLLQRLERLTTKSGETALIFHDEGDAPTIRTWARKSRRAGIAGSIFGSGVLKRPFRLLVDDPVPRTSVHSYLIQLADLNAYAAYRRLFPDHPRISKIVPRMMWDELGNARHAAANALAGGPPGIVSWPR
jgi:hypothetical protein